jgi:GT2 family glycosyltransferase
MLLSVIVVNWNSCVDLAECLSSLQEQTYPSLEVIVVDNGSTDGSLEMVRERFPAFVLLSYTDNLGFAEGCNRGIEASKGEWVALLNNDAVADRLWAERLVDAARKAPATRGMLQSEMFFLDRPGVINSMGLYLTRTGGAIDRLEGEPRRPVEPEEIFCPTGGACAYRRTMLESIKLPVGYFDREYFMYAEDFDLGWRAQLAGWSAELAPGSIVHHRFHGSTARRGRAFFVVHTRANRLRTLIKNASPRFLLRTAHYTFYELCELSWHGGWRAVANLPTVLTESLRQRANIDRLASVRRVEIEKRWVGDSGSGS